MHLSSLQIVRFSQFIVPRVVVVLDSDLLHALEMRLNLFVLLWLRFYFTVFSP